MSLSGLIEQNYFSKIAILNSILERFHPKWIASSSLEERLAIEADAIDSFLEIIEKDIYYPKVSQFEKPDVLDFEHTYKQYETIQKANSSRIANLLDVFLARSNTQEFLFGDLVAQVKRIKQKHAVLNLWNNEKVKYFTGHNFLTTDGLANNFSSDESAAVLTSQGALGLPIQLKEKIEIANIKIGANSNGIPGNSDAAVTTNNQNVQALLSNNSTQWFEYERMDAGPCRLTLQFELTKPQIVNFIKVVPLNIGVPLSFKIEDIIFTMSSKESISIFDLLPENINEDIFSVPIASYTEGWELHTLPVEAVSVSITFVQTSSYSISVQSNGIESFRQRFAIPLQSIELNKIKYKIRGGINSEEIKIKNNLYAVEPVIKVNPDNNNLYNLFLELSFDGGEHWVSAATDDGVSILPVTNNKGSFLWRLSFERLDEAFQNFTSFFEGEEKKGTLKTLLRSVSRFSSPVTIGLSSKPADSNVYVLQPKIARRGKDSTRAIRLGAMSDGQTRFGLPFNVLKRKIRTDSVRVYARGEELERENPGTALTSEKWQFSDDHNQIILSEDIPVNTSIYIKLDEEIMNFEERVDGYYHQMKFDFDPDKNNIEINLLARDPARASILLDRNSTTIDLNATNIFSDSFELISTSGTTWTSVPNRSFVYDAPNNDYYIDTKNGILYLASIVGDDSVRASFTYQQATALTSDQYEIIYEDNRPWGIKINKDAFEAFSFEESIEDDLFSIINIINGEYGERDEIIPGGSITKKQLSYDCIIKGTVGIPLDFLVNELIPEEIEYVDGITEFLGLVHVTNETTSSVPVDSDRVAQFGLAARNLWYRDLGVSFSNASVFSNKRNSINQVVAGSTGDYYVDDDGIVYVKLATINSLLPANIQISYYYKDSLFDPNNKYSIDYDLGIIYTYTEINQSAIISYKTACYKVGYDIAKEIKLVQYLSDSNTIEINTESLDAVNNQVKIIWTEDLEPIISSAASLYFSPLISSIGFRFS